MPSNPFVASDVTSALAGRFTVGRELRVGGQGVVYRATRITTPAGSTSADDVALKLHMHGQEDIRAEREINAMEGNRHPNLANLIEHGFVTIAGRRVRYAAWEFIDGDALDHHLAAGALNAKTVCVVGRDVARAIDHLWSRDRIVHRDVNPKNIMLRTGDRESVLIDLGAAKHLQQVPITAPLLTWGTNGYLSPEQARADQNLSSASDVFSLAITLQEALVGRHPTAGDQSLLLAGGPKTAALAPTVPAALANIIDRMYAPRAAFRPQPRKLADEFAALAQLL